MNQDKVPMSDKPAPSAPAALERYDDECDSKCAAGDCRCGLFDFTEAEMESAP